MDTSDMPLAALEPIASKAGTRTLLLSFVYIWKLLLLLLFFLSGLLNISRGVM